MATIKSFTDISQSKKLAGILPLESADMHYCLEKRGVATGYEIGVTNFNYVKRFKGKCNIVDVQPSWSLAALIDVIPKRIKYYNVLRIDINEKDTAIWYDEIAYRVPNDLPDITKDNPIDACYEMIIKLNELNLL